MLASLAFGAALISSTIAALPSASPATSASEALITPGPPQIELLRRQNDIRYMGWIAYNDTWTSEICDPGNTYFQAPGQWACCATTKAGCQNLPIGCLNGNMIYRNLATGSSVTNSVFTRACSQIYTASEDQSFSLCNTAFMFENDRDSSPKVNIVCGVSTKNWSYYRQAPQTAITASTSGIAVTSNFALPPATPVSVGPTSTSSPNPTPVPIGGDGGSKSKAWIAGAVVGPLVGLALIGLAAFFFMRRRKNQAHNKHVAPATGSMPPAGATAYQQNSYPTNPASPQPPQYYPNMQQTAGAVPFGGAKQDTYYAPGATPQSPMTSQGSQSPYGAPQQWQQPGGQPVYGATSPTMNPSPQPQNVQPAQYMASESRPFSSELEGSVAHGQPETINVQPKK